MERIHGADERISALADRLGASRPTAADAEDHVELPDPAWLLEQERRAVLEAAQAEGLAQGLLRADADIRTRIQAAEKHIEAAHAEEGARLRQERERLTELLAALPNGIAQAEARMEAAAVEIAYAALTQLLGDMDAARSLMPKLCRRALAEYQQRPLLIRVAAEDVPLLSDLVEEDGAVRVAADARLTTGQCQLETHKGLYDTGIDVRLAALTQAFLGGLSAERPA